MVPFFVSSQVARYSIGEGYGMGEDRATTIQVAKTAVQTLDGVGRIVTLGRPMLLRSGYISYIVKTKRLQDFSIDRGYQLSIIKFYSFFANM